MPKIKTVIVENACTFLDKDFNAIQPQGVSLGKRKQGGHFVCACTMFDDCDASKKRVPDNNTKKASFSVVV